MKFFWKWLCLFSYRRYAIATENKPTGIPNNRDPNHPCTGYEPRTKRTMDWGDCDGDGHYLCDECCHKENEEIL